MKNLCFLLGEFLCYQWKAQSKYYLHSPFVFQFQQHVLEGEFPPSLQPLHEWRSSLSKNHQQIHVEDFGTRRSSLRTIASIEKQVAVREKYGCLLHRMVLYLKPRVILEIGGSIGISAAYMALAKPDATLYSLEGSASLSGLAKKHHASLGLKNIQYIIGNFEHTLPQVLQSSGETGLIFFDGNHTGEATLRYFHLCLEKSNENSVFIFDDIYLHPGMKTAWETIRAHPQITLSIDLFQFGICFFRKDRAQKEHFVLRY